MWKGIDFEYSLPDQISQPRLGWRAECTTVSVPIQQMALAAVQMIVHRLGMKEQAGAKVEYSPQVIRLAPQLVMRESAGLAPQS